jgi:hypothetical protein
MMVKKIRRSCHSLPAITLARASAGKLVTSTINNRDSYIPPGRNVRGNFFIAEVLDQLIRTSVQENL